MLLYTGNIRPPFNFRNLRPRCQRANFRLGEFLCLKLSLLKHKCVWANLTRSQTISKCKGEKIAQGENNSVLIFYHLRFSHTVGSPFSHCRSAKHGPQYP